MRDLRILRDGSPNVAFFVRPPKENPPHLESKRSARRCVVYNLRASQGRVDVQGRSGALLARGRGGDPKKVMLGAPWLNDAVQMDSTMDIVKMVSPDSKHAWRAARAWASPLGRE